MISQVLVTGATGFIGGHLVERCLSQGLAVRAMARQPDLASWLAGLGAEVVRGDLLDQASLARAVTGCDAILHAAAWTGGGGPTRRWAWEINVTATDNLLHLAQDLGVRRFLYFSSVAVYGLNSSPVIDETSPTPSTGQLYPDSKIAAEALVHTAQAQGLPTTIIRPACTYGPRGTAWTVNVINQIKSGRLVLLGRDEGLVNTGYVDNLVDGVMLALHSPAAIGQAFNLCDGTTVTYRQFYLRYATMLGRDSLPTRPAWIARGARTPPGQWVRRLLGHPPVGPWSLHFRFNPSRFSIAHAQRLLGYVPAIDFDEGMRRTQAWLGRTGYL